MAISLEELYALLEERNGFPLNDRRREVVAKVMVLCWWLPGQEPKKHEFL
jgi:hypothetical protein